MSDRPLNIDEKQDNADWPKFSHIKIDPGRHVLCDSCGDEFTDSSESGGILVGSKAICPTCAPQWEADMKRFGESHLIRARCPDGKSFADWVREDLR